MLPLLVFLQVAGSFVAYGIVTTNTSELSSISRELRKGSNRSTNWQTVLKDATFQSLIKHTGFTPSLDEKMETDRLLWEKIQAAKFLRKTGKAEETDKVKMGVLIDMTRDNGQLEFRQTDRSLYNCPEGRCKPILNRLLAIWRIQKFEPNDVWIRIKIPKSKEDDVYEYTPKLGLKQVNMADSYISTKMKSLNKHKKGVEDIKILNIDERVYQSTDSTISRNDRQFYDMEDVFREVVKKQRNYQKPKRIAFSTIQGTQFIPHIIGLTIPPNPVYSWNDGTYYQVDPVKILSEFQKNDQTYDGFVPSNGPTGNPHQTGPQPVYQEVYPPNYLWDKKHSTTPKNFKPSVELINYSPLDPFFHEDEGDKFTTITTTRPVKNEEPKAPSLFPSNINEQLETYVIDIDNTTEKEEEPSTEINTQPTAGSINVLHVTEKKTGKVLFTTNDLSKIQSVTSKPKQSKRYNITSKISSAEAYDYAPLYIKWGEKIKSTNKTNSTKTSKINTTPSPKAEIVNNTQETTAELTSKNVMIENISKKSPEEVVNTLTNIGVQNTTRIEGYPEISQQVLDKSNELINKLTDGNDQVSDNSDPISIVINRISQSYSYKTSNGQVRRLKKV